MHRKGSDMKADEKDINIDKDLRTEYHFDYSKAVRGKYYRRILEEGTNVAVLEPDIAEAFPDSASVNDGLRLLLDLTEKTHRIAKHRLVRR
jgi:hypothetical protein